MKFNFMMFVDFDNLLNMAGRNPEVVKFGYKTPDIPGIVFVDEVDATTGELVVSYQVSSSEFFHTNNTPILEPPPIPQEKIKVEAETSVAAAQAES